jgi:hypothetical protein
VGVNAAIVGAGVFHTVGVEFALVFAKGFTDTIVSLCHVYLPSIPQRGDDCERWEIVNRLEA